MVPLKAEDSLNFDELFVEYPDLRFLRRTPNAIVIDGDLQFSASSTAFPQYGVMEDTFYLRIEIPVDFPKGIPIVFEPHDRIKPIPDNHKETNGALCLGSPLQLYSELAKNPNLLAFLRSTLIPFLYAYCVKERFQVNFCFGGIGHGIEGLLEDYRARLNLDNDIEVICALRIISRKPRVANKYPCPCGCKKRLGKCVYRFKLNSFRHLAPRKFFAQEAAKLEEYIRNRSYSSKSAGHE